jgi:prolyl oligopeptidase
MRTRNLALLGLSVTIGCESREPKSTTLTYPETRKDTTVVDDYFGVRVPDPYRWLEDDNSAETAAWVDAQNAVTFAHLSTLPDRERIRERLTQLYDFERYSTPTVRGGKWFFYRNDGLQDQSPLYVQDGPDAEPRVLIDPNTLSEDGTVALGNTSFSRDGKYLAYQVSGSGSDWNTIRVLDIETGRHLEEELEWVKFSGMAWLDDGFFYSGYDAPAEGDAYSGRNEFHKVYFHQLGTPQEKDVLVHWNAEEPMRNYGAQVTHDGQVVMLYETQSTSGQAIHYRKVGEKGAFLPIVSTFDHDHRVVHHADGKLLVHTNNGAPNYRLVEIDLRRPEPSLWKDIVAEGEHVMEDVQVAGGKLVVSYLRHVSTHVDVHELDGTFVRSIALPTMGEADFSGAEDEGTAFFGFRSFNYPNTVFQYDIATGEQRVFWQPKVDFDPEAYEVKQVFHASKDGTRVPMFIVHKKGLMLDGDNPCLLYGYGGFNISVKPGFSANNALFLENGGVYAVANLRGGGEYGEQWHKAGTKERKQNVFDDFIASAEYLIAQGYTRADRLAISGRSNGGLLVGAVMTQRPELFKVALPGVGVLDMLRFHRFTIGWAWKGDYGSSEDAEGFGYLHAYSPLHNVRASAYPATLVTTADHDDRVVPAHSFKFIATLQAHQQGDAPVLIRIDKKAGHGAGKPIGKVIDEQTDVWAFVFHHLGLRM